jgi:hypothetical protein
MDSIRCTLKWIALAATLGICAFSVSNAQQRVHEVVPQKQVKDQGESEIYNQAIKDASNPAKAIEDLDLWTDKYPDSDFNEERLCMYMQAYSAMKQPQPQKVIEIGQHLMAKDLNVAFPGAAGGRNILTVLFQMAWNVAALPNSTPDQLALGDMAAHQLLDFAPKYFVAGNKPPGTSEADWTKARDDIEKRTRVALVAIALAPANQALANNDCAAAEALFTKVLSQYPNNSFISYNLGRALSCEARDNATRAPELAPRAVYEFVRAAVIDATLGGTADAKKVADYATSVYAGYHGNEEGLDQLKQQARVSPLPPAGFTIESAAAVFNRTQKERAEKSLQYSLWMSIKAQLSDAKQQYFEDQLKDADVRGQNGARALKGILVEARPACRSRALLVAIPDAEQPDVKVPAEIALKLEVPLGGKPVLGATIEWDGIAREFTREPAFLLTMETARAKISGLKLEACAVGPGAPKKK